MFISGALIIKFPGIELVVFRLIFPAIFRLFWLKIVANPPNLSVVLGLENP